MSVLYIFNPENDLALANGSNTYCAPPKARKIAFDLASLPLWYASAGDKVLLPDMRFTDYHTTTINDFNITAEPVTAGFKGEITTCTPWGWSPQIIKRFKDIGIEDNILPSDKVIERYREISHRRTVIDILSRLDEAGVRIPYPLPKYITSADDVEHFILSMPRSVIKAPWSGSGKGLVWGRGYHETSVECLCRGIVKRQGGAICEKYLENIRDFAMEFYSDGAKISFAGYSLFSTNNGVYCGNMLASDTVIEEILLSYVSSSELSYIRDNLLLILSDIIGSNYIGYLGVDMMIYRHEEHFFINPCVELNIRMNMGAVARLFYDKYVGYGKKGEFKVSYMRDGKDVFADHLNKLRNFPLKMCDGRVVSGYLSLASVSENTNYRAEVIIG
ncbi:MAG: hypothetical protein RR293_05260 [Bacteroidales bacterium]